MEINLKTDPWEKIRDAILETIDRLILHKAADHREVYRLMKAAWLETCEEIYKRLVKEEGEKE